MEGAGTGDVLHSPEPVVLQRNKMSYKAFTPADAAILLVDHQPGVLAMVKSLPVKNVAANAGTLARLANDLEIPLVVTSTRETLEWIGTTIESIQEGAPAAYAARIRRPGTLNPFDEPDFVAAVEATGRKNLVIAGVLTDVCLAHTVLSALASGYAVQVVADANGTTSALADTVTYTRLKDAGAIITTTWGILFELFPNLQAPEGQKAEAVAGHAIVADESAA